MTALPADLESLLSRAQEMQRRRRYADAAGLYEEILRRAPPRTEWLNRLARARLDAGDAPGSIAACRRSLDLDPLQPLTLVRLASALRATGEHAEAATACRSALSMRSDFSPAHTELGRVLARMGRLEDALRHLSLAVHHDPASAQAHFSLGMLQRRLGQLEPALHSFSRVLSLNPQDFPAHLNRALVLSESGRLAEAISAVDAAIALRPDDAEAHVHRAEMLLTLGSYEEGWRAYEWRWRSRFRAADPRLAHLPVWDGHCTLSGKTVLVTPEVGLGDFIMFFRYVPDLVARGAKVILWAPRALHRLLAGSGTECSVAQVGRPPPPADFRIALMSLPRVLGAEAAGAGYRIPYLRVGEAERAGWRERIQRTGRLRVGLAWSGASRTGLDDVAHRRRSAPAAALASLLEMPADFHSLQKEVDGDPGVYPLVPAGPVRDHREWLHDLADTAALIEQMDLVISIDTSVAHLAGALGKPLWLALPFASDYRWPPGSASTPWYPQARLFRPNAPGDWESVAKQLASALARTMD